MNESSVKKKQIGYCSYFPWKDDNQLYLEIILLTYSAQVSYGTNIKKELELNHFHEEISYTVYMYDCTKVCSWLKQFIQNTSWVIFNHFVNWLSDWLQLTSAEKYWQITQTKSMPNTAIIMNGL